MVGEILATYRQIKDLKRKERQLAQLKATPLNYTILRDLLNSAQHGVVIHLTMTDGTRLDIRQEDAFDRLQRKHSELY